ncbi:MAG: histidine phosphatase family protein [Lachnospiraceae bacterium]|nr:histidine phosphatase family protein [Candidatus Equihabitans merdae]
MNLNHTEDKQENQPVVRTIYLIRHGITPGNSEKRYVGRTDEGLMLSEEERLPGLYPQGELAGVKHLVCSPMKRCRETAAILFPGMEQLLVEDFKEMDFGDFEYKNYQELKDDPAYQAYLDSMGRTPFPNSEPFEDFNARVRKAFEALVPTLEDETALVVHGGTIMAILSGYGVPQQGYFDYMIKNGCGYCLKLRVNDRGRISLHYKKMQKDTQVIMNE